MFICLQVLFVLRMYQYLEDAMEPENRNLKESVLFPSKTTFKGRRWDGWDANSRERTINNCEDRLVISHTDADGFVSASLLMDYFGECSVVNIDYENIEDTLDHLSKHTGHIQEVYVTDLNLDEMYEVIGDIESDIEKFVWLDHHEWGDKEKQLREMGVEITINQDRCAAGIVLEYLQDKGYKPTETALETVHLTEDHDLWKHEMERINFEGDEICISKIFSQMAFFSENEEFMKNILDYGRDFLEYEEELLRGDNSEGFLEEREEYSRKKLQYVLENQVTVKEIENYNVGFAYGRTSPGELLEELKESIKYRHSCSRKTFLSCKNIFQKYR